jgi:protein TonB
MLDVNKIMSADILDIIFDGRNKDYGAYELRKSYTRRLTMALGGTAAILAFVFIGYFVVNTINANSKKPVMEVKDVSLEDIKEEKKNEPPPPPPPPKQEPPKVEMAKFTPPKIVKDEEVKEEEKPPEQDKLEDTKIGTVNQEGVKDDGLTPPVDNGKGVVEAPKKVEEDWDKTFTKVETESQYGENANDWGKFLYKTLVYPQDAQDNEIQGTVIVQFIVDKEGNVSDVEAISGPNELRAEAMRVIKKSGKWKPAIQNGRQVKSYKKQPITFKLETQ